MTAPLRIFRVTYTARRPGPHGYRKGRVFVKVPYGGSFAMTELLTRMVAIGQVERFEVAMATKREIASWRPFLRRWLPALTASSNLTGVDWTA